MKIFFLTPDIGSIHVKNNRASLYEVHSCRKQASSNSSEIVLAFATISVNYEAQVMRVLGHRNSVVRSTFRVAVETLSD